MESGFKETVIQQAFCLSFAATISEAGSPAVTDISVPLWQALGYRSPAGKMNLDDLLAENTELAGLYRQKAAEKAPFFYFEANFFDANRRKIPAKMVCFPDGFAQANRFLHAVQLIPQQGGKQIERTERTVAPCRKLVDRWHDGLFHLLVNHIDSIFWIQELPARQVIYLSPSFEKIWGIPAAKVYADQSVWQQMVLKEDQDVFHHVSLEKNFCREFRIVRPDGTIRWIRDMGNPVFDAAGNVCLLVGIAEDITELKMKDELLQKTEKLRLVGELAAGIAHEVRNPLTTVKGFIQLLQREIDPHVCKLMLQEMDRIAKIVDEFLFLAKPKPVNRLAVQSVSALTRQVTDLLLPEAILHNVQLVCETEDFPFVCDANQIKQVLINLIKNAIEAMPIGGIVKIRSYQYNETLFALEIIDGGVGIAPDRLDRLGEPFFSQKEKGIGLGLMICFKIIENHRGRLQIDSELGQGTKATIYLPIAQPADGQTGSSG
ncbi:ATP-binding protein [Brevibacillus fulvus]|uniref:histidine kinase n=1 Tax=Brevibacillus fulvus TaxID=1125967 RepID=A0A939BPM9_9BACL|nr:ATP-binding protein [Brevibacillus fulvus]MBM7590655.1 PAS domain S-box-containing protein [Brevibacillus fulvus]